MQVIYQGGLHRGGKGAITPCTSKRGGIARPTFIIMSCSPLHTHTSLDYLLKTILRYVKCVISLIIPHNAISACDQFTWNSKRVYSCQGRETKIFWKLSQLQYFSINELWESLVAVVSHCALCHGYKPLRNSIYLKIHCPLDYCEGKSV